MFLFIISIILFLYNKVLGLIMFVIIGSLFNTRFLNPLGVQYQQWKATKQMFFNS